MNLENVDRIGISLDKLYFINKEHTILPRKNNHLYIENVVQIQDELVAGDRRTAILLDSPVTCISKEHREHNDIYCGKNPEEMSKL